MSRINDVEARKGYRLIIELQGGNVVFLNMADKVDTIRFFDLKDEDFFQTVETDGYSIYWDFGRIKLGLTEIYDMINKPVVASKFANSYDYAQDKNIANQTMVG
ncbi:MAG: DUF2442 domain-containing protein [Lachnospiraceae bacterium]|nr:DUF2442 domain-containing protein [Lachnospiraceae bacterium]